LGESFVLVYDERNVITLRSKEVLDKVSGVDILLGQEDQQDAGTARMIVGEQPNPAIEAFTQESVGIRGGKPETYPVAEEPQLFQLAS
jgi:hypothetical protein